MTDYVRDDVEEQQRIPIVDGTRQTKVRALVRIRRYRPRRAGAQRAALVDVDIGAASSLHEPPRDGVLLIEQVPVKAAAVGDGQGEEWRWIRYCAAT